MRIRRASLVVAALVAFAALMWNSRGQFLFEDEWAFYVRAGDFSFYRVFESHLGNLHAFSNLLYTGMFRVFGPDEYLPLRLAWALLDVMLGALLYVYARPRIGHWAALAAAGLICFFGAGWDVTAGPLGITLLACTIFGLSSFLLLQRETPRSDVGAAVMLALSLATYSAAVAWVAGAAILLAQRGRAGLRTAWVVAAPLTAYAGWRIWELVNFDDTATSLSNILSLPSSLASSLAALMASLTGTFRAPGTEVYFAIEPDTGRALAVAAVIAIAVRFAVRDRWPLHPRVWALIAMPLVFWSAIGVESGAPLGPNAGRYQFIGAVFALLLAAELCAGRRPPRPVAYALAAAFALSLAANLGHWRDAGRIMRENGTQNRAQLAGLDLVRENTPYTIGIELLSSSGPDIYDDVLIPTDLYFTSVDNIGSVATPLAGIPALRESVRQRVDLQMEAAMRLLQTAPDRAGAESVAAGEGEPDRVVTLDAVAGGEARPDGDCVRFRPHLAGASVAVTLPPGGTSIDQILDAPRAQSAVTRLRLRRFGDRFANGVPAPGLGAAADLTDQQLVIAPDASPVPWHLELTAQGPVSICPIGEGGGAPGGGG